MNHISHRINNLNLPVESWNYRYQRITLQEKGEYVISSSSLPLNGFECPSCQKSQPFSDWWCVLCGGPSIMGEPGDDENGPEFDRYFETDEMQILTLIEITKFGNCLYKRLN